MEPVCKDCHFLKSELQPQKTGRSCGQQDLPKLTCCVSQHIATSPSRPAPLPSFLSHLPQLPHGFTNRRVSRMFKTSFLSLGFSLFLQCWHQRENTRQAALYLVVLMSHTLPPSCPSGTSIIIQEAPAFSLTGVGYQRHLWPKKRTVLCCTAEVNAGNHSHLQKKVSLLTQGESTSKKFYLRLNAWAFY